MTDKRVVLSAQARRDIRQITAWYREEGGTPLALQWVAAMEDGLRYIGAHPKAGSPRYATTLQLGDLRFFPVNGFPYLVFYFERQQQIDIGRVLHTRRDIPAWMGNAE